jgi:hypothetical protein
MTQTNPSSHVGMEVQRQVSLPTSKAVEIAWMNIRMRMSRSLIVTSGIVLALAFLMFILCDDAVMVGMRNWMRMAPSSPEFVALEAQQRQLMGQMRSATDRLAQARRVSASAAGKTPADLKVVLGGDVKDVQRELGELPLPPDDLKSLLTVRADLAPVVQDWMRLARLRRAVGSELTGPQRLTSLMKQNGIPTTLREIDAARVQTRWLLGVALLVAFAGILNAMLMSVTERFREIGTMKCLGALDSFIVKLFLIESSFQGAAGTVIGILLGLGLSLAGASSSYGSFAWQVFPVRQVALNAGICFVVGVALTVAGAVYPAWQAARMHPIEAMRAET